MQTTLKIPISDSFVSKNKLRTKRNSSNLRPSSGESRIYIGPQNSNIASDFFSFTESIEYKGKEFAASNADCYFLKNNLLEYLTLAFKEYHEPSLNYFYDISAYYFELMEKIKSYETEKIVFTIFKHVGERDTKRFYLNSKDEIWRDFRKLVLPHISCLTIARHGENEYQFSLTIDSKFVDKELGGAENSIKEIYDEAEEVEQEAEEMEQETDYNAIVTARKGQGKYKNNLLATMESCPFTGISDPILLIASHAKPWSESNNTERLNGYNGLLLTPTYDVLFDRGLISFTNDGELLVSSIVSKEIICKLQLIENEKYNIANEHGQRNFYLAYHREKVFKG